MSAAAGAFIGGGMGSSLGQIGDFLAIPRKALWSSLGLPEHGNQLVSKISGLDEKGLAANALGVGAEILLDPLTYLGMLGGAPLGHAWKLIGQQADDAAAKASLAAETLLNAQREASALSGINRQLQGARASFYDQTVPLFDPAVHPNLMNIDMPGIITGQTKTARYMDPDLAQYLFDMGYVRGPAGNRIQGLATDQALAQGAAPQLATDVPVIGSRMPAGVQLRTLRQQGQNVRGGSGYFPGQGGMPDVPMMEDDMYAVLRSPEVVAQTQAEMAALPRKSGAMIYPPATAMDAAGAELARRRTAEMSLEDMLRATLQGDELSEVMGQVNMYPTLAPRTPGGLRRSLAEAERLAAAKAADAERAAAMADLANWQNRAAQRQVNMDLDDYASVFGAAYGGGLLGDVLYRYGDGRWR